MAKAYDQLITLFITLCITFFIGCEKQEIGPQSVNSTENIEIESNGSLLIANEGNFAQGNASLSQYDIESMSVNNNVYNTVNTAQLGDVFQSIYALEESLYFIINNSSKIIEVDNSTLGVLDVIVLNGRSPRYMVSASNDQSFISNFALNPNGSPVYIDVLDNLTNAIIDSIDVGAWTEEMIIEGDMLLVCVMGESEIVGIDVNTHEIIETYPVGREPSSIVRDKDGFIWVLCTGGFNAELPSLWKVDVANNILVDYSFSSINSYPNSLKINGTGDSLYFLNDGIFKMSIYSDVVPELSFVSEGANSFYTLGVDPVTSEMYVSDPNGFQGNGLILRFAPNGSLIDEFEVGAIPSYMHFN